MNIAIYSRKSIFTEKGDSVENQIELCKNYCNTHLNLKNINFLVYEDEGFSGKNLNRPKFKELINDIKNNKFSYLVCYRLDRISRNVADFSSTLELLQENNVNFISIKEQFDTSTPMGRAMIYIASVFAQLERETIAERVKDNMLQLAKMGKWSGGQLPLGFNSEKLEYLNEEMKTKSFSKLIPVKEELEIVKFIYSTYLQKGSLLSLVKELNDLGYKTKTGSNFELSGIKRILKSTLYVKSNEATHEYLKSKNYKVYGEPNGNGYLTYNKKTDKDNIIAAISSHKGIISAKDWLVVQRKFDENKNKSDGYSNRTGTGTNESLFSGLLKCGKCGSNMVVKYNAKNKEGKNYIYYTCSSKNKRVNGLKCDTPNLRTDIIDEKLINEIKTYNKNIILDIYNSKLNELSKGSNKDLLNSLNKQISEKTSQIHNLIKELSLSTEETIKDILRSEMKTISSEIESLKLKIDNVELIQTDIKNTVLNIKHLIKNFNDFDKQFSDTNDIDIKRNLIRNIIEKVTFDNDNKKFDVKFFYIDNMHLDSTSKSLDSLNTYKVDLYDQGKSIGDKLKYHRLKACLTQDELAKVIGLSKGSCIKSIELNQNLISRKVSIKLADFFNVGTKYFYDEFLEVSDIAPEILKKYRIDNNLSINEVCNKFKVSKTAWRSWENSNSYISRESYLKLKNNGIFE